ncbi:MAG: bifunctional diguanylate cyclase/phosphohydrolase [Bacillota bacterium]
MRKLFVGIDNKVTDLQNDYNVGSQPWTYKLKDRVSTFFFTFVIIHIIVVVIQASGVFPVNVRAICGILEIGLSIFLSYRFGCLGMLLSILTNSLAAIHMARLANQIHMIVTKDTTDLPGQLNEITNSAPGLLFTLSATRVAVIVASIMVAYTSEQERKHIKRLEWLASIDGVTGVYNHRYFQTRLEEEIVRANDRNSSLGMMMIDVDNFKRYNDTYGHKAGDILLSKTSEIFMTETRKQDIVCRYGGDEFAILMPEANSKGILSVIERIRKAFNEMTDSEEFYRLPDQITLSVGYSIYPDFARNKDDLIMQADSALYQAKNMGRNNVQLYRDVFEDIKAFFNSDEHQLFGGLRALLGTVSAKDKYTLGHSERVMDYAVMIGRSMGLTSERLRLLKIAALLHDIGKVEIPEAVLNKCEPLTSGELNILRKHPSYSVDILEPLSSMELLIDSIKYHHERFDGKGYPSGIKGNDIPLEARILCVADAFDAMLSDRPYRKGMKMDQVVSELKNNSGTQFDPETVKAFLSTLNVNCEI